MGENEIENLIRELCDSDEIYADENLRDKIIKVGETIIPKLLEIINSDYSFFTKIKIISILPFFEEKLLNYTQEIIRIFHSVKNPYIKADLIELLGFYKLKELIPFYKDVFCKEKSDWVKFEVIKALTYIPVKEIWSMLIEIYHDEKVDYEIKREATKALSLINKKDLDEIIIDTLQNDDKLILRCEAATWIGSLKIDKGYDLLIEVLKSDEHRDLKLAASLSLMNFQKLNFTTNIIELIQNEKDMELKWNLINILVEQKNLDIIDHLVDFLDIKHPIWIRLSAIEILGDFKALSVIEELEKLLVDKNIDIRCKVIEALSKIKMDNNKDLLLNCLENEEIKIQLQAIKCLQYIDEKGSLQILQELITEDSNEQIRRTAFNVYNNILFDKKPDFDYYRISLIKNDLRRKFDRVIDPKLDKNLKGNALEDFCIELLALRKNLVFIGKKVNFFGEEIDILYSNRIEKGFLSKFNSPYIFVECKNLADVAEPGDLRDFGKKIINHRNLTTLGIFVSVNGFREGSEIEFIVNRAMEITTILLTKEDIIEFLSEDWDFDDFLEKAIIKYETKWLKKYTVK